jgi:hypothetical protein
MFDWFCFGAGRSKRDKYCCVGILSVWVPLTISVTRTNLGTPAAWCSVCSQLQRNQVWYSKQLKVIRIFIWIFWQWATGIYFTAQIILPSFLLSSSLSSLLLQVGATPHFTLNLFYHSTLLLIKKTTEKWSYWLFSSHLFSFGFYILCFHSIKYLLSLWKFHLWTPLSISLLICQFHFKNRA